MNRTQGKISSIYLDLLITLLGLLGLALFLAFYDQAFPSAAIDLKFSRDEISRRARAYLEEQGHDLTGYQFALTFDKAWWSSVYLERTLGIPETNRLVRDKGLPLWLWQARWFKPLQKQEFSLSMTPTGEVVAFFHSIPEDTPGAQLWQDEARALARRYLSEDRAWSLSDWEPVTASSEDRPGGRIDHHFEWKRRSWDVGESELRLAVDVQGSRVDGYGYWLKVPEAFQRYFREQRNWAGFINNISFDLGFYGLGLIVLLAYFSAQRKGILPWHAGLGPGLVVAGVELLSELNWLPLSKAWYDTTQEYALFWAGRVMGILFSAGLTAVGIAILWTGGRQLAGRIWPRQDKLLPRAGDRWEQLARSTWRGLMLGGLGTGYVVAFYLIATQLLGGWIPLAAPYTNLYATPLPFLAALSVGLSPALVEEFLFRLIGVGLFLKLARNRFVALLVPGAIWAFAHLVYVRDPFYLRGIELTIAAVLLFGLFFLRFDLATTMMAHFAFNAGGTALPLLRSSDRYFVASGVLVIGAMLAPAIPGFVLATCRRLQGKALVAPLITISPATTEDVTALEALPIPGVTWNKLLLDPLAVVVCLRAGERLAGVAAGRVDGDGVGHVLALFVAPNLRRRYWGSALADALIEALRERGAQLVTVEAAAADWAVRAFWSAQGFELSKTVYSRLSAPMAKTGWRAHFWRLIDWAPGNLGKG